MNPPPDSFRVLVVEDEVLYAQAIARALDREGVACDVAHTGHEAREWVKQRPYDLVVLDHRLPDDDGIQLIPTLRAAQERAAVVVMTAYETIASAIQAIRLGAEDYLVKQTSVAPIVDKALEVRRRDSIRRDRAGWGEASGAPIGESQAMRQVLDQLQKVARGATTTVLLTGETGVGKEVAARHLHALSTPKGEERPFIAVDCIAMPGGLVESVLFGHEKGAFTGADRERAGAFHDAGRGTVLLDEVGDMDLSVQGKLLRVLESRRFHRVGSTREHHFEGRVVAATNRDLALACEEGRFRFDLYQRLSAFPVELPPLRGRGEDILRLAEHFQTHFARSLDVAPAPLSPELCDALMAYDYPGNVRELKNVIERAIILRESGRIGLEHLPERMRVRAPDGASPRAGAVPLDFVPGVDTLASLEARMVEHALRMTGGAKAEAARILGITRFQLLRRLEKYGLD